MIINLVIQSLIENAFFSFKKVVVGQNNGIIKVYDTSLNLVQSFQAHVGHIIRIRQSPFPLNHYVVTCSEDKQVKVWKPLSANNWQLFRTYTMHSQIVFGIEFIDEDTMASGGADSTIKLWSISTLITRRTINTYGRQVWCLQLLGTQNLASGGEFYSDIIIYNINTGSLVTTLYGHLHGVFDFVFIPNRNLLVLASSG